MSTYTDKLLFVLSVIIIVIMAASFTYVFNEQPNALKVSRNGVPLLAPKLIHPETGKVLSIDELVIHYKGD